MNEVAVFRMFDILYGLHQTCSEAVVQLRISHLYQLQKDRKSLYEKFFLLGIAAATILPTLEHFFPDSPLKWLWLTVVLAFALMLYLGERERIHANTSRQLYESAASFDQVVKKSQETLLRDNLFSYVSRHEIVYKAYHNVDDYVKPQLLEILESYQYFFKETRRQLVDLMNESRLDQKTYDEMNGYISKSEERYRELAKAKGER